MPERSLIHWDYSLVNNSTISEWQFQIRDHSKVTMLVKDIIKAEVMASREVDEILPMLIACFVPQHVLSGTSVQLEAKLLDRRPAEEAFRLQIDVLVRDQGAQDNEVTEAKPKMRLMVWLYTETGNAMVTGTAAGMLHEWDEGNRQIIATALDGAIQKGALKGDGMVVEITPLTHSHLRLREWHETHQVVMYVADEQGIVEARTEHVKEKIITQKRRTSVTSVVRHTQQSAIQQLHDKSNKRRKGTSETKPATWDNWGSPEAWTFKSEQSLPAYRVRSDFDQKSQTQNSGDNDLQMILAQIQEMRAEQKKQHETQIEIMRTLKIQQDTTVMNINQMVAKIHDLEKTLDKKEKKLKKRKVVQTGEDPEHSVIPQDGSHMI